MEHIVYTQDGSTIWCQPSPHSFKFALLVLTENFDADEGAATALQVCCDALNEKCT